MGRVSRADVARAAGVSVATVSHVMNGRAAELGFNPQTAARVEKIAAQLGYIPRAGARNLRYQRSQVIGFFIGEVPAALRLPVFNELLLAAITAASASARYVLPIPLPRDQEANIPQILRQTLGRVDFAGVLVEPGFHPLSAFSLLEKAAIPTAWITPGALALPHSHGHAFGIDEAVGVRQLLAAIDTATVRTPVMITGPAPHTGRVEAFLEAFPQARIETASGWLEGDGEAAIRDLVGRGITPDLVFTGNDFLGKGALRALSDLGLDCPDKVQLFSYGGFLSTATQGGEMSAVRWPLRELATLGVQALAGPEAATGQVHNLGSIPHPGATTRPGGGHGSGAL